MKQIINTALISVSDKTHLVELAEFLIKKNIKIISTGGTAKVLQAASIPFTPIEQVTGNPESFGGRMKTISFQIASSLLYRRGHIPDEVQAHQLNIPKIDLVVCNFYPFEEAVKKNLCDEDLIEEIDIGGPLMCRAAAKNYQAVTVLSTPTQYHEFIHHYHLQNATTLEFRQQAALKLFQTMAHYDIAIVEELQKRFTTETEYKYLTLNKVQDLRYGENPHQKAIWFHTKKTQEQNTLKCLQGKELSYNNLLDLDAGWKIVSDLTRCFKNEHPYAATIIKHGNPCGLCLGGDPLSVLEYAWQADNVSAFGSVIAVNFTVNAEIMTFFENKFVEVITAPHFDIDFRNVALSKKNLRLVETQLLNYQNQELSYRSFFAGLLIQNEDERSIDCEELRSVTQLQFPQEKMSLAKFGIIAAKYLKSNAIALVENINQDNGQSCFNLVGAGMGQPNRLDSLTRLAVPRAKEKGRTLSDVVLISDAFFPFSDSIIAAFQCGIKYIVQPGGSIKDQEVIDKANELGISMMFSGIRHFRH